MEFTLFYRGPLRAKSQGNLVNKQQIRAAFHKQLQVLWQQPPLDSVRFRLRTDGTNATQFAKKYPHKQGTFTFAAIVWESMKLVADLDITFLRPGKPGRIIGDGGDIDNRLKTLFDALQIPTEESGILQHLPPGMTPEIDPVFAGMIPNKIDPVFHCVLEDDSLISSVSVKTDHLLLPANPREVVLIIRIRTRALEVTEGSSLIP